MKELERITDREKIKGLLQSWGAIEVRFSSEHSTILNEIRFDRDGKMYGLSLQSYNEIHLFKEKTPKIYTLKAQVLSGEVGFNKEFSSKEEATAAGDLLGDLWKYEVSEV